MKRVCELCKSMARIHCEADQASLCSSCDAKVHSANFLVARHSRNLLCRICRSPARWSESGSKLKTTSYLCRKCINGKIPDESSEEDENDMAEEMDLDQFSAGSPPPPESDCETAFSGGDVAVTTKRRRRAA